MAFSDPNIFSLFELELTFGAGFFSRLSALFDRFMAR
jgi:hypothetical protein